MGLALAELRRTAMTAPPIRRPITRREQWVALLLAVPIVVVGLAGLATAPDPAVEPSIGMTRPIDKPSPSLNGGGSTPSSSLFER
jgi:hypothetical protein